MLNWLTSYFYPEKESKSLRTYGWRPDDDDSRDKYRDIKAFTTNSYIDLRHKCPKIYNQGTLGSCTANAIAAAYEFDEYKQSEKKPFMPSRLFIYYNERKMEGSVDIDSGAQIRDGIKSINRIGVVSEEAWPYDEEKFTNQPPEELYILAKKHQSVQYQRVKQDITHIKQVLQEGYPIVFGFVVYKSFETPEVAKTGMMVMPKDNDEQMGGHAVMAVGYDDKQEVVIVRNSWGEEWGDKGYFYMPYEFITNSDLASDFWTVQRVKDI